MSLIAGCGKQKEASGQVVAKVDGKEISIYQLNNVLARTPGITPQNADEFRIKVLDQLIDQQLAIGKAQEKELDRTPEVIQSLEEAKRDILSRSYLDKISATVTKTTDEEAKTYYKDHPELFGDRHIYQIQELATPAGRAPVDTLLTMVKTQSAEEVEKWVKEKKIEHVMSTRVLAGEQMSPAALQEVRKLKVGQAAIVQTGGTVSVLKLLNAQSSPVTEAVALPQIRRVLDSQKTLKAMTVELKQLRDKAKIEITGVEGKNASGPKVGSKPVPAAASPEAVPVSASVPAVSAVPAVPDPSVTAIPVPAPPPVVVIAPVVAEPPLGKPPAMNIEKGVAGLK